MTISEIAKKWGLNTYHGMSTLGDEHTATTEEWGTFFAIYIQSAIDEAMLKYHNEHTSSMKPHEEKNRPNNSQGGTTEVQLSTCNLKEDDADVN